MAEATLQGLGAEEGRKAVRCRDKQGSVAKGRQSGAWRVGGVGALPQNSGGLGLPAPLLGPHASFGGGQVREHVGRCAGPEAGEGSRGEGGSLPGSRELVVETALAGCPSPWYLAPSAPSSVETRAAPRPPWARAGSDLRALLPQPQISMPGLTKCLYFSLFVCVWGDLMKEKKLLWSHS